MIIYEGTRAEGTCIVTRQRDDGEHEELPLRLDLWNKSPTGFEWGYGGSGPAQLSLALLADVLADDERAIELFQAFKREVVSGLEEDHWKMTDEQIREKARNLSF